MIEIPSSDPLPTLIGSGPGPTLAQVGPDDGDAVPRAMAPFTPSVMVVPDAGVNAPVEPRAATNEYNPFLDEVVLTYPVPDGPSTTVWWDEGPRPGDGGLAVILGHARSPGDAVFNELPGLTPGAQLVVAGSTDDGQAVTASYRVTGVVSGIAKTDPAALRSVLDDPPTEATLALITCSGTIDEALSSKTDNTVVFAVLDAMYDADR